MIRVRRWVDVLLFAYVCLDVLLFAYVCIAVGIMTWADFAMNKRIDCTGKGGEWVGGPYDGYTCVKKGAVLK